MPKDAGVGKHLFEFTNGFEVDSNTVGESPIENIGGRVHENAELPNKRTTKIVIEAQMSEEDLDKSIRFVYGYEDQAAIDQIKRDFFSGPIVFDFDSVEDPEKRRYNQNGLIALAIMLKP